MCLKQRLSITCGSAYYYLYVMNAIEENIFHYDIPLDPLVYFSVVQMNLFNKLISNKF